MLLIALVFIIISIKMFVRKLKVIALTFVITLGLFTIIAIPNVDAFIAKYNVNRYLSGTLQTVDLEAMEDLGTSSIPALTKLKVHLNDKTTLNEFETELNYQLYDYFVEISGELRNSDKSIFSYTIPDLIAKNELKEIGYF